MPTLTKPTAPARNDELCWWEWLGVAAFVAFPFVFGFVAMRLGWIEGTWREFLFDLPLGWFGVSGYALLVVCVLAVPCVALSKLARRSGTRDPRPNR